MDISKRELLLIGLVVILLAANIGIILKTQSIGQSHITEETLDSLFVEQEECITPQIAIHVTGAVKNRGVVHMEEGARVVEAIQAAGGALDTADLNRINLARELADGERIYVPAVGETVDNYIDLNYNGEMSAKVNINTASADRLEILQGIGPVLAARIVEFREKEGRFEKPEDIMKVSGIGTKVFENLKDDIVVR